MPDIMSDFLIRATASEVFRGVTAPTSLDTWWTKTSSGEPRVAELYTHAHAFDRLLRNATHFVWRRSVPNDV